MDIIHEDNIVIQPLQTVWYQPYVAAVDVLRLDLLHPVISGNKWFKLNRNLQHAQQKGLHTILTFGGAYSNHLIATAAAAQAFGLKSIGIVHGLHAAKSPTTTLKECEAMGMRLIYISRELYGKKHDTSWLQELELQFDELFIIPEGGANNWGREGVQDIAKWIPETYTHICVSVGTGTTMAGLRNALPIQQQLLGFVPMKQGSYLKTEIEQHLWPGKNANWHLFDAWHFGGFAKCTDDLINFMNSFYAPHQIPLDMVYTAKMMYGVHKLLADEFFPADAHILCIHTGGLQGNVSVRDLLNY